MRSRPIQSSSAIASSRCAWLLVPPAAASFVLCCAATRSLHPSGSSPAPPLPSRQFACCAPCSSVSRPSIRSASLPLHWFCCSPCWSPVSFPLAVQRPSSRCRPCGANDAERVNPNDSTPGSARGTGPRSLLSNQRCAAVPPTLRPASPAQNADSELSDFGHLFAIADNLAPFHHGSKLLIANGLGRG